MEARSAELRQVESETIAQLQDRLAAHEQYIRALEEQVSTDTLTGLLNRRGLEKFFLQEQQRIRRQQSPGALFALIDFDRFKAINDEYGHPAGDACLKHMARTLAQSIRVLDAAARLGGDEFVLVLTQ